MNGQQPQQKQVAASEDTIKGRYTNHMQVFHNKEEFVMDFFFLTPQGGALLARFVTSPPHMKRTLLALQDNIKKYEEQFGKIEASQEKEPSLGFQV